MMKHSAVVALFCAATAACAPFASDSKSDAPPVSAVRTYSANYACQDGRTFLVRFSNGAAVLDGDGGSVAMNQKRTADGFLYAGGGQSLRGRGHDATWTDKAGKSHLCHDATGEAPKPAPANGN